MEIVLSGIRSTGNLHLGNYFGAMQNFVKMQEENKCFFFIADYHSLTTHPTPENLLESTKQVLVEYLAVGIDPEKCTLYRQSDIPEITELYLLLNMNVYLGELERCTTFKDKARQQPNNINAGLLTYPVLMAADILIHRALKVPVGKDQEQHLEMTRNFATRFNRLYKVDYFPEPTAYNFGKDLIKIPGLDGSGKMGKSEGNAINLADEPEVIRKKVMKAVTDSGPTSPNQEMADSIKNLFTILKVVSTPETVNYFNEKYNDCSIRYGDFKKQLAEDIISVTTPIREKIIELKSNNEYLRKVISMGAEKARESASKTIKEVREIIGFKSF
ncbi:MAG: tryptophan--tRNA ligase [Bacteroidetes bacterium GWA2_32_17]|nr:MAG: tryptophan--tRNA ligase [Bacteroidetes bacterium GWA2_32_17]